MGFGGMSPGSLLLIFLIVLLLFGSNRLKNVGSDLANAIKSFRRGMEENDKNPPKKEDA